MSFYNEEKFEEIEKVFMTLAIFMVVVNMVIMFISVFIYNDFFFLIEYQMKALVLLFIVWVFSFVNLYIFDSSGGFDGKY